MASYEKRGNKWSVRFRENGKNKRLSSFDSKLDAVKGFEKYSSDYNNDYFNLFSAPNTFEELLNLYLENRKGRIKESSYYTSLSKVNTHIRPFFGRIELQRITPPVILSWQSSLRQYSYKYRLILNNLLTSIFLFGEKYYDLPNPMKRIDPIRNLDPKREMKVWTPEEYFRYISVIDDPTYALLFRFLYISGCRKGEALALGFEDIDVEQQTVRINKNLTRKSRGKPYDITTPKNQSSNRFIDMPKELLTELVALRQSEEDIFVFGGNYPLADSTVTRRHKSWIKKSGVKNITIHEIRHSHASFLISNGVSIVAVSRRLGHSSIKQTLDTYSHMMPSDAEQIVNIFEGF